jgi:hypothetical protein
MMLQQANTTVSQSSIPSFRPLYGDLNIDHYDDSKEQEALPIRLDDIQVKEEDEYLRIVKGRHTNRRKTILESRFSRIASTILHLFKLQV